MRIALHRALLPLVAALLACNDSGPSPTSPRMRSTALSSCDLPYPPAASAPYALPFERGSTFVLNQAACPPNPNWGHHGSYANDFEMPIGTRVTAARDGLVYFVVEHIVDGDSSQANGIGIEHADGTVMQYFHFTVNGALVEVGDFVAQGQLIGLSGNTGPSSGPHLHLWLLRSRSQAGKADSLPISYSNAGGPLDENGALVQSAAYTAL
jgi:murein DD-endopeptidase MepM/ murein hydrolase activator NlpD